MIGPTSTSKMSIEKDELRQRKPVDVEPEDTEGDDDEIDNPIQPVATAGWILYCFVNI